MADLQIKYPPYIETAFCRMKKANKEVFLVGGALRDTLLGRETHDFDLATSALPCETAEIFSDFHCLTSGLKHGTVTVIIDGNPVEITTYRMDGNYKDSRHPETVSFTPLISDDLSRRDFTINAMAYNRESGVIDLFGGREDLKNGIVRAVGDPKKRFSEDALRIMRAFRFVSKLNFSIDANSLSAARECKSGLLEISAERKTSELEGILLGEGAENALSLMHETGIFQIIAHGLEIYPERFSKTKTLPRDFATRLAFIFCRNPNLPDLLSKMKLSNAISRKTKALAELAVATFPTETDGDLRRLMSLCGENFFDLLAIKAALGEDTENISQRSAEIYRRGDCLTLKKLAIGGKELSKIGIKGEDTGYVLNALLQLVLDAPELNRKVTLLEIAKTIPLPRT